MRSTDGGLAWAELLSLASVQVNDLLETGEGSWLLATTSGVKRLAPSGSSYTMSRSRPTSSGR